MHNEYKAVRVFATNPSKDVIDRKGTTELRLLIKIFPQGNAEPEIDPNRAATLTSKGNNYLGGLLFDSKRDIPTDANWPVRHIRYSFDLPFNKTHLSNINWLLSQDLTLKIKLVSGEEFAFHPVRYAEVDRCVAWKPIGGKEANYAD